ncbi:MAG: TetR/AcrR family transcriptional regulator [Bacilli bacterium]|nr:TetR/AcrR family transcriptional regulator [Bacilli bacterium]
MEKENDILIKAKELFGEIGYKATTMDMLAAKCNIGKGTIYLYFNSKEEVLQSIVNQLIDNVENIAKEIEETNVTTTEQIKLFLKELLNFKNEQIVVAKLVFEAKQVGNKTVKRYINQLEDHMIQKIQDKIDNAVNKGLIEKCNTKFMAFLIYKIYLLLVLEWEKKANAKLTEEELFSLLENLFNNRR